MRGAFLLVAPNSPSGSSGLTRESIFRNGVNGLWILGSRPSMTAVGKLAVVVKQSVGFGASLNQALCGLSKSYFIADDVLSRDVGIPSNEHAIHRLQLHRLARTGERNGASR